MWHLTLTSICSLWYYVEMCLSGRAINMWRLRALLLSSVCTNVLVVFVDTIAAVAVVVCVDCALQRIRTASRWSSMARRVCWTSLTRLVKRNTQQWGISICELGRASSSCLLSIMPSPSRISPCTGEHKNIRVRTRIRHIAKKSK